MPDELMTLTMTREVFPHFKELFEAGTIIVGDNEIKGVAEESAPGVIRATVTSKRLPYQERG